MINEGSLLKSTVDKGFEAVLVQYRKNVYVLELTTEEAQSDYATLESIILAKIEEKDKLVIVKSSFEVKS